MTAPLVTDIYSAALYAASAAPSRPLSLLYCLLGIFAAIAYKVGASFFPLHREQPQLTDPPFEFTTCPTSSSPTPLLLVVIPAFICTSEEAAHLTRLTTSLPPETIVVDDCSPYSITLNCTVIRHTRNRGPAAARNTGLREALHRGARHIAFTDADCLPASDWPSQHATLQMAAPGIWSGRTLACDTDIVSQFHNHIGTLMPRVTSGGEAIYAPTCNLSISAAVARRLKFDDGFPTSAFEDCDFCVRARELGFPVSVSSAPVVRHRFKSGIMGLVESYFKYGRSFPIMLEKHPNYKAMLERSRPMTVISWKNVK